MSPSWKSELMAEFEKPYFSDMTAFVTQEYRTHTVYPRPDEIFRAFELCPFEQVRVVILGQDPYHGLQQANGLSFAVHDGTAIPPSLRNIFKEIAQDMSITADTTNGDLSRWAVQGVLLLNATLTVRAGSPGSHQHRGWEEFTDATISKLSADHSGLVFMLWGAFAQQKAVLVDRTRHLVLEAPHPSPFSAHRGFFGCSHFSTANEWLVQHGRAPIDWR